MSKCKEHPFEVGPGICASCLRLRLLSLLAASLPSPPSPDPFPSFPRSVSPYLSHRHRRHHDHDHDLPLFLSTPQPQSKKPRRLSSLTSLFRTTHKPKPDLPPPQKPESTSWLSSLLRLSRKPKPHLPPDDSDHRDLSFSTPSPAWRIPTSTPARRPNSWLSPLGGRLSHTEVGIDPRPHHRRHRHGSGGGGSRKLAEFGKTS